MFRKILLVTTWFPITALLLLVMLVNLHEHSQEKTAIAASTLDHISPLQSFPDVNNLRVAAATLGTGQVLSAQIVAADARPLLLRQFMQSMHKESPLIPFAEHMVAQADAYGIDYTLVPTIAECESNLGIRIPPGSYNAWGIAVYTGQQSGATFKGWEGAIEWVSKYIKEKYYDQGLTDLRSISEKWAPPSVETGYSWANCVNLFQSQIL